jgi:N,N'-diacetylbacillosaminyl-diphospho-undecaprenol alpha-1,3-N-acetylgalactosaminyltransferase
MVARAIWDKGVREYYEASKTLKQKYPDVECLLIGGTDRGNPSCASEEFLNTGDVRWLGHRDDIAELTAICDIYVLPSFYREGLPATLMEAAAMSKPIVTTDTVGCKEVVDEGINGFLVPIKDPKALTQKIEILLNDENLRITMGQKGREKALREFDVTKVVQHYMEYYETFI